MNVVLFGATGMIGAGVLIECLDDPQVESVLAIGRSSSGVEDSKLTEVIHQDFFDYSVLQPRLESYDVCFFCLGVSSAGMGEEKYHHLTYELTLRAAEALVQANPGMTFCYISGAGTDSTEQGRSMWARVKGKTENALLQLPFRASYMLRPGYIQPLKGIKSSTRVYRIMYALMGPLYPVWKTLFPGLVTTTEKLGLAMIRVAREGYPERILETRDINALVESVSQDKR